jgi:hypothetical protein
MNDLPLFMKTLLKTGLRSNPAAINQWFQHDIFGDFWGTFTRRTGAGIAQWCSTQPQGGWWGVQVPEGAGNFSLHHHFQTSSGAHPASCPVGIRGPLPGERLPRRETDDSPPSSVKVRNAWSYTSTPQYASMAWCSVEAQGQLYLSPLDPYIVGF